MPIPGEMLRRGWGVMRLKPWHLAGIFASSIDANAVHGSDAPETAAFEVGFFFPGMAIYSR